MAQFVPSLVQRWYKADGVTPAFGWSIGFYKAGLDPTPENRISIYDETSGETPIENPAAFDAEGKVCVLTGDVVYKVVVWKGLNEESDVAWEKDQIGNTGFGSGFVLNLTALKALAAFTPGFVFMAGRNVAGDGGHGMFYWDAGDETADDDGYTIAPASAPIAGRWKRVPDEDGDVRAASFGYLGNVATIQTTQLSNADTYAASVGARLSIGTGTDAQVASLHLTAPLVHFAGGGYLKGTVNDSGPNADLVIDGIVSGDLEKHFTRFASITLSSKQVLPVDWVGAVSGNISLDNTDALQSAKDSGAGVVEVPDAIYYVVNGSAFTIPTTGQIWKLDGTINNQTDATIYEPGLYVNGQAFKYGKALSVTDLLHSDAAITAGTSVTADTSVTAGTFVQAKAGVSSQSFYASGRIFSYANATGVTGNGNLLTASIKGNTLGNPGDALRIRGAGVGLGNATALALKIYFGGSVVATLNLVGNNGGGSKDSWYFDAEILFIDATHVLCLAAGLTRTVGADANDSSDSIQSASVAVPTLTLDRDLTINSNVSITQRTMLVDYIPAAI